ncbi:hypothetical protein NRK67_08295 [Fusobacteria bacterium ZRK30]|nr:hypothetical protein NRK67_08295 [Fusobacteria bacterium ZRK30]
MSIEKLEELMTPEDFREYQRLYSMKEDVYSPQWYAIQDMMQKILAKYGLDTPEDPYGREDEREEEKI